MLDDIVVRLTTAKYNNESITSQINSVLASLKTSQYDPDLHYKFVEKTMYYDKLRNRNFKEI